jgi:glutaredoxin 3
MEGVVTMFTKPTCGHCTKAKAILAKYPGITVMEIDVNANAAARAWLLAREAKTVPQIYLNDFYVGGASSLAELDAAGDLGATLAAKLREPLDAASPFQAFC